jgi:hypothetical protein
MATTRRTGALAALALVGAIALSACTTPEPQSTPNPVETSSSALREQLLQVDGLSDPSQSRSYPDYTLEFAIDDPDRAEEATLEALDLFSASGVPEAITQDVADTYDSTARFQLSIIEAGSKGGGPHLDLPMPPDADKQALADAVATWSRMGQIEGVDLRTSSFDAGAFTMTYAVDFEGLLASVRPTSVIPQLHQILADSGYDPAASTITGNISAPEAINTVGGEEKYVQGTRFARIFLTLKPAAGPNYGSVLYFIHSDKVVDIYVLPKLGADGTLLPLDLTAETARTAGQTIQADDLNDAWKLRDIIVFTQDGMQTFPAGA